MNIQARLDKLEASYGKDLTSKTLEALKLYDADIDKTDRELQAIANKNTNIIGAILELYEIPIIKSPRGVK